MNSVLLPTRLRREEVFASAAVPLLVQQHVLDGTYERHSHDFMEIVFILRGEGQHATLYGVSPLTANDVVVIRPGIWHAYQDCRQLVVYNCCFALELLEHQLAWLRQDAQAAVLLWGDSASEITVTRTQLQSVSVPACVQQLEDISALIDADPQQQEAPIRLVGHLMVLLGTLLHGLTATLQQLPHLHRAVQAGMALLAQHMAYPWTLHELAEQLHIDPAYLVRLFTAQVQCAPMTWLARQRIERAATLLTQTALPITQIGAEVGWDDPNHFARRFRHIMGMSASAYRAAAPHSPIQTDITHHQR